ncbi:MAG: type I methionyl aminopeptidase [Candidatus Taylorbacteria bacterium]|nr:type I methionyl aminopeptidase [Candidatus Taylorbacteria bacterium]
MIQLKSKKDIEILREAGKKLAYILASLEKATVPGVSSFELEDLARKLTKEAGATPAFLGYTPEGAKRAFPAALCLSVNNAVVHGIPNEKEYIIKKGDLVVLDMGIVYKKMIVDSAITVSAGGLEATDEKGRKLLQAGKECLDAAIEACRHWKKDFPKGIKTGDIGQAIENAFMFYHKKYGFNMAEHLGGHGVGFKVHEDPFVPNLGVPGQGPALQPGTVIAIEPILNEGKAQIRLESDGYTITTIDGKRSVHFEHTIAITEDGVEVLTEM